MFRLSRRWRPWIMVFSLWLALQPLVVSIVQANDEGETAKPELDISDIQGIEDIDKVMTPHEYLEYILTLKGSTKEEMEAVALSDWMMTITTAYMQMDAGCQDVFSMYGALQTFRNSAQNVNTTLTTGLPFLAIAGKHLMLGANYVGNALHLKSAAQKIGILSRLNMMKGFAKTRKMTQALGKSKALEFLKFMSPPPYWTPVGKSLWKISAAEAKSAAGFKSYWRWVKRVSPLSETKGEASKIVMKNSKGVARTLGIGLCVLGIALDSYGLATNEDLSGGRFNWSAFQNTIGLVLGVGALVAMFCVPIVGQIAAIATLAWMLISALGNVLGAYNAKWHEAYKNSHWFLMGEDDKYQSFYEKRHLLKEREKSAAYLVAEKHFKDFAKDNSSGGDEAAKRNQEVWNALEQQGVLMTYYQHGRKNLPDFSMERLMELWQMKADYMSWKPNEAEAKKAETRGFWGSVGHAVNPMTYISMAGDAVKSRNYKKTLKKEDIQRVFFNPDFVLLKKFQNYLLGNKLRGGLYNAVGLRIEQAPFNYMPLISIDTAAWNEALLTQAFEADAFIVGSKELLYIKEQVKLAEKSIEDTMDTSADMLKRVRKDYLPYAEKSYTALEALITAYETDADMNGDEVMKTLKRTFGWHWTDQQTPTPRTIMSKFRPEIEQMLTYEPISLSQQAAEMLLLMTTYKHTIDTAKLMRALSDEKHELINSFETTFPNESIQKYLKEGKFLDVNKGWWDKTMNWLSELYPAYSDMKTYLNNYDDSVKAFEKKSRKARDFADKDHPRKLLESLEEHIKKYSAMYDRFEAIKGDTGLTLPIGDQIAKDKVFIDSVSGVTPESSGQPMNWLADGFAGDVSINLNTEISYDGIPTLVPMNQ